MQDILKISQSKKSNLKIANPRGMRHTSMKRIITILVGAGIITAQYMMPNRVLAQQEPCYDIQGLYKRNDGNGTIVVLCRHEGQQEKRETVEFRVLWRGSDYIVTQVRKFFQNGELIYDGIDVVGNEVKIEVNPESQRSRLHRIIIQYTSGSPDYYRVNLVSKDKKIISREILVKYGLRPEELKGWLD